MLCFNRWRSNILFEIKKSYSIFVFRSGSVYIWSDSNWNCVSSFALVDIWFVTFSTKTLCEFILFQLNLVRIFDLTEKKWALVQTKIEQRKIFLSFFDNQIRESVAIIGWRLQRLKLNEKENPVDRQSNKFNWLKSLRQSKANVREQKKNHLFVYCKTPFSVLMLFCLLLLLLTACILQCICSSLKALRTVMNDKVRRKVKKKVNDDDRNKKCVCAYA